jgi:hypothetical protein
MRLCTVNRASWSLLVFGLVAGCSSRSEVQTAKVEGVVLFKGRPIKDIAVVFHPTVGPLASGKTDAEGKFRLSTVAVDDGAKIGEHKVTLVYRDPNESTDAPIVKSPIPRRYSVPETSGLTATVADKDNFFTYELKE